MKIIYLVSLFLFLNQAAMSLNTGNGSDGHCTETTLVSGKRNYQCITLTISGAGESNFSGVGGAALIILVQQDVIINGVFNLNGANGENGNDPSPIDGGLAGAGGSAGASCPTNSCTLENGSGTGAGGGGTRGTNIASGQAGGAGGAGGSFGTSGTDGVNGADDLGSAVTRGSAAATYGNENNFESNFDAGSGGGAGGAGDNNSTLSFAGAGGGSGGNLKIVAGGSIYINNNINTNGGNGGNGNSESGAGGGGSGGAVWLQSEGQIVIQGGVSITATGGSAGTAPVIGGPGAAGNGGTGGKGRIRLDDSDGSVGNIGLVDPAPVIKKATISSIEQQNFESDISCAFRENDLDNNFVWIFIFGFFVSVFPAITKSQRNLF